MESLKLLKQRLLSRLGRRPVEKEEPDGDGDVDSINTADYPIWPPATPHEILGAKQKFWKTIQARKFAAPFGDYDDKPIFVLYRLYEYIMLDKVTHYRDQLEYLWRRSQWPLRDIPDPQDKDPERYAMLAGIICLMVRSFNARIKLGLSRTAKPLISMEEIEAARNVADEQRPYEKAPEWAIRVLALDVCLKIPTEDGTVLEDMSDARADPALRDKNILLWTPRIYFT